jgi:hypothetical protein
MSKTVQSNYKPKDISLGAILKGIKEGTREPAHPKDAYGNFIPIAKNPRYSNDPTGKGDDRDDLPGTKAIVDLIDKFEEINAKDKCLRVRFYDWFADYLERMAGKIRDRASKITTPCSITLPSMKSKKVESNTLAETATNTEMRKDYDVGMKLPDEEVKKIVPDLTPDDDKIVAVKNATEIANAMIKAGNPPETFKITPDIQRAIEVVAKAEAEYARTLTYKEKK